MCIKSLHIATLLRYIHVRVLCNSLYFSSQTLGCNVVDWNKLEDIINCLLPFHQHNFYLFLLLAQSSDNGICFFW